MNAACSYYFGMMVHLRNSYVKLEYVGHSSGQGQGHRILSY